MFSLRVSVKLGGFGGCTVGGKFFSYADVFMPNLTIMAN